MSESTRLQMAKAMQADIRVQQKVNGVNVNLNQTVDAALNALSMPSDDVLKLAYGMSDLCVSECFDAVEQMRIAWSVAIQAIREGK